MAASSSAAAATHAVGPPAPTSVAFEGARLPVGALLGSGGQAWVYSLESPTMEAAGLPLAAKIIHAPSLKASDRERVRKESEIWGTLSHPHIIRFLGRTIEDDVWLVFVLEQTNTLAQVLTEMTRKLEVVQVNHTTIVHEAGIQQIVGQNNAALAPGTEEKKKEGE